MHVQHILGNIKNSYIDFEIKSKQKSILMKLLNLLLFFVPNFMSKYTTVINNTIYFPQEHIENIANNNHKVLPVLFHELMHISDKNKSGKLIFMLKYLFPQILAPLAIPLFLLFGFKYLLFGLLILPLPAYFRRKYEERGYMVAAYVMKKLNDMGYKADIDAYGDIYLKYSRSSIYYFMWLVPFYDKTVKNYIQLIKDGKRPFEDKIFDVIDECVR